MTFEEKLKEKYEAGEDKFASLAVKLFEDGRSGELKAAKDDHAFRQKLYEEYGIE